MTTLLVLWNLLMVVFGVGVLIAAFNLLPALGPVGILFCAAGGYITGNALGNIIGAVVTA